MAARDYRGIPYVTYMAARRYLMCKLYGDKELQCLCLLRVLEYMTGNACEPSMQNLLDQRQADGQP